MRNCFVPACDAQCKDNVKRMMFLPPKDEELFQKWVEVLPKKREFKKVDRVCDRHFKPEDIIKTWQHIIEGKVLLLDRDKPKLKPDAIPELNIPTAEEYSSGRKRGKRTTLRESNSANDDTEDATTDVVSPPKKRAVRNTKAIAAVVIPKRIDLVKKPVKEEMISVIEINECADIKLGTETDTTIEIIETKIPDLFEALYDDIYDVTLPSTLWGVHRDPERTFIVFTYFEAAAMGTTKTFYIDHDLKYTIKIGQKEILSETLPKSTTEMLSLMLTNIEEYILCKNYYNNHNGKCEVLLHMKHQVICRICKEAGVN